MFPGKIEGGRVVILLIEKRLDRHVVGIRASFVRFSAVFARFLAHRGPVAPHSGEILNFFQN